MRHLAMAALLAFARSCSTPTQEAADPDPPPIPTTLVGEARNVKGGSVVVAPDGERTWVELPGEWPPSVVGHRVVVEGQLERRKGVGKPRPGELAAQGIAGPYWALAKVKYRVE
jgi:hypothetical protein